MFASAQALAKERKKGDVITPSVWKMVKRETESYELLPDYRLL